MKTAIRFSLTIVSFVLVPSVWAQSILITTTSAGDGYFHNESGSSYDYFDSTSTTVSAHYEYWGTSDTLLNDIGYLQFDLTNAPAVEDISSVTLGLYLTQVSFSDDSTSAGYLYHVSNASGATGLASQKLSGSELIVEIQNQAVGWNTFDVTSYLLSDLNNGYNWAAFSANPNTSGYFRNATFSFYSADYGSLQPVLIFSTSAVPEPAATTAFVGGIVLIGSLIYRRRRSVKPQT